MYSLDLERLREIVRLRRDEFMRAEPFPHLVIDDFLDPAVAAALEAEFAQTGGEWIFYHHVNERKRGFNDVARMGSVSARVIRELTGDDFVTALRTLTGVERLHADHALEGSGLAELEPGGYVNVHADFLSHPTEHNWVRSVNFLLFLNHGWSEADGGQLELWDARVERPVQRFLPIFNRCVVFATGPHSYHAVPVVHCSPGRVRRSLALYYFRDEGRPQPIRSTNYVPRPGDPPLTRALIRLDDWLLRAYAALKRYTPFGDRIASRVLRRLSARRADGPTAEPSPAAPAPAAPSAARAPRAPRPYAGTPDR
jgi:hypothetical protein